MTNPHIIVSGLSGTIRAFNAVGGEIKGELRAGLREISEIVAEDERAYLRGEVGNPRLRHPASNKSIAGIRTGVTTKGVRVYQRYTTVTGKRGDWGRRVYSSLYHAAKKTEPRVESATETLLGRLAEKHGF